jgi:hypothetical protein
VMQEQENLSWNLLSASEEPWALACINCARPILRWPSLNRN